MSDYKWNGGSSFNGKEWDSSLPSDAAVSRKISDFSD